MTAPDIWLCEPCGKGGEEKGKTPLVDNKPCEYCGALCQNMPVARGQPDPNPLPRGAFVTADTAPPPRALSRAEREAQVRHVEPEPEPAPIETPALPERDLDAEEDDAKPRGLFHRSGRQ